MQGKVFFEICILCLHHIVIIFNIMKEIRPHLSLRQNRGFLCAVFKKNLYKTNTIVFKQA